MASQVVTRDAARVKKAVEALVSLTHYMPTLQSEADVFAVTCAIDDGQRTLKLGRHVALKLQKALDALEQVLTTP